MVSDATISGYESRSTIGELCARACSRSPTFARRLRSSRARALAVAGERLGGVTVRGVEPELEREVSSIGAITREGDIGALVGGGSRS